MAELAAIALAFVFCLSAILKLLDRPGTVVGFGELGVPSPTLTMWLVITVELMLAVSVIILPMSAWLAAALLVAFTVFLAIRLWQGTSASCRCFGAASRKPFGWTELARNAVLIAVAILATSATF